MRLPRSSAWDGERVELFQLLPEHIGSHYVDWLNDPAVNRYLESRFNPQDQASVERFVAANL